MLEAMTRGRKDHPFHKMLKGWRWTIIPAYVERDIPLVAPVLSQGLNSDHSAITEQSELEVAAAIANYYSEQVRAQEEPSMEKAVKLASASRPKCSLYIKQRPRCIKLTVFYLF